MRIFVVLDDLEDLGFKVIISGFGRFKRDDCFMKDVEIEEFSDILFNNVVRFVLMESESE